MRPFAIISSSVSIAFADRDKAAAYEKAAAIGKTARFRRRHRFASAPAFSSPMSSSQQALRDLPTGIDHDLANAIRGSVIGRSPKSGHPGMPMGMARSPWRCGPGTCATAPIILTGLRDRFVLSSHGSSCSTCASPATRCRAMSSSVSALGQDAGHPYGADAGRRHETDRSARGSPTACMAFAEQLLAKRSNSNGTRSSTTTWLFAATLPDGGISHGHARSPAPRLAKPPPFTTTRISIDGSRGLFTDDTRAL